MIDMDRKLVKQRMKTILKKHKGPEDCITMCELFVDVTGNHIIPNQRYNQTRLIRSIVKDLREEGCPIGIKGGTSGGYFWARNDAELKGTIEKFHKRSMSGLRQEAALRRITFNQLLLELEDEYNKQQEKENVKAA